MNRIGMATATIVTFVALAACAQPASPGEAPQGSSLPIVVTDTLSEALSSTRATNPGPDLSDLDFWTAAGLIAVNPAFVPDSLSELSRGSSVVLDGTIVNGRPFRAEVGFAVELDIRKEDGGLASVVLSYPRETTLDELSKKVPLERAVWFVFADEFFGFGEADKPRFGCISDYLCAFIEREGSVVTALRNEDLSTVWPDMKNVTTLDQLMEVVRRSPPAGTALPPKNVPSATK